MCGPACSDARAYIGFCRRLLRRVVCERQGPVFGVQASARWGIAPRMKAVTPVRLAHAPRKAGPAVVRVKTIIEGGGFSASALWQRVGRASSPLTRRGLGRGARRARHARQCGLYDNQQRCRGHPPRRARHGLYGNLRSRRHPCVQRPERGIPRGDGRRAPVGQETYESGFQSELIKNKSRTWKDLGY